MSPNVVAGNALADGEMRRGWFMGHFITPADDPRSLSDLELKCAVHKAGEGRAEWATNTEATTLSLLISGRFRIQFPDQEIVLANVGDYVLWLPGVAHHWWAEIDSTILTIRWPSIPGDSLNLKSKSAN